MGKQGPCCHCGVTSTPLWRNGPPEKPVLCNACGSRWRTKGTLANYTPLHARVDPDDYEDHRVTRVKTISLKRKNEWLNKRKLNHDMTIDGEYNHEYSEGFQKYLDEDASNRSSSGSAISNSESCALFGSADASDLTGPQSIVWDAQFPSKKRTCVARPKQSSVEKLAKDLHTILHELSPKFSSLSEEDLLFESEAPKGSVEFGHGSVLIRQPSSIAREEESEASSLSVDIKLCRSHEGYTAPASTVSLNDSESVYNSCSGVEKVKKLNGQVTQLEQTKRVKSNHEKVQILWNSSSVLSRIDLTEIANSNVFYGHFTADEQQNLLKYLPSVDTSKHSDSSCSLNSMFANPYFIENLQSFQKLLAEGVLDSSCQGIKTEHCKVVKGLVLSNMNQCKWVQCYNMIKDKTSKESMGEYVSLSGTKSSSSADVSTVKISLNSHNHVFPEAKTTLKIPDKVLVKIGYESKETIQNEVNPFAWQNEGSSLMLDSVNFEDENSDQDLLLNIPPNGSFPQAELLHPASSYASHQATASSSSTHPAFLLP